MDDHLCIILSGLECYLDEKAMTDLKIAMKGCGVKVRHVLIQSAKIANGHMASVPKR